MKKFVQRSFAWIVALIAMFSVSGTAWAKEAIFDFSQGFVAEVNGVTCTSDGEFNSANGFWQVRSGKYVTFTAPYGSVITEMVLNDNNYTQSLTFTPSTGDLAECDWGDFPYVRTWTGSANSVKFESNGFGRLVNVKVTFESDPNAHPLFPAFTSAFPADGAKVQELGEVVLGLPAGVTLSSYSGAGTIFVNGVEKTTKYSQSEAGISVAIPYINEDGQYTIVIPREFVTATDGSVNPELTLHYTVASPYFTLTKSMVRPNPDQTVYFDRDMEGNKLAFTSFRLGTGNFGYAPANSTIFDFKINDRHVQGSLLVYADDPNTAVISFVNNPIREGGDYTFLIPAGALTTTDGRTNREFSWVFSLDVPKAPEFSSCYPEAGTSLKKSVVGQYSFSFTQPLKEVNLNKASIAFPDGTSAPFSRWANAVDLFHSTGASFFTLSIGNQFMSEFADHLMVDGPFTFEFPATCLTTNEDMQNPEAFSVSYDYVAPTFYTYEVVIVGLGDAPNATVTVDGVRYSNGQTVSVAEYALEASDVTNYQFGAYRAKLSIRQPADGKIGAIVVTYSEAATLGIERVSPADGSEISLDDNEYGLGSITIFVDGVWAQSVFAGEGNPVPAGVTLTGPEGPITINANYGFCMWEGSEQININHSPANLTTPGVYTLHIPAGLNYVIDEYGDELLNPEMNYSWTVTEASQFAFDSRNAVALPEDGKSLTGFKLYFPSGVQYGSIEQYYMEQIVYDEESYGYEGKRVPVKATFAYNQADRCIDVTLGEPITEKGSYSFVIPAGAFKAADGRTSKEVRLSANVDPNPTVYVHYDVTPADGATVESPLTAISLTFPKGTDLSRASIDVTKASVFGTGEFKFSGRYNISNNILTLTLLEPIAEGSVNYMFSEGFVTFPDGSISSTTFGYNITVVAPSIDSDLDRDTYVLFDHVGNSTQDGFTVAATMYDEEGIINIYGAPESFTQGWGLLKINGERHILGVELTIESGDLYSVAEANSSDSQFLYEGNTVLWVGSANSLTFSAGGDVYVSQVKVYYDANETVQKSCTVGISHYADNCAPGEVKAVPANITIYMERGAAVQLWNGSDNNTVGVSLTDASGQNLVRQFNTWVGSTQLGIVLDHAITAPGTYTLNIPEGIVRFENGAYNRAFNLTWTIKALGDLDGNGVTTLSELNTIVDIVLEKAKPVNAADVNNDEEVNIVDIVKVIDQLIEASK